MAERGLALASTAEDRFELTCLRGDLLHDLGTMPEAGAAYRDALAAAADDGQRCRAWLGLAAVKRVTEDLDGAFADLANAEAAAIRLGLTAERSRVHFLRGNLLFPRGDFRGILEEHEKSLRFAKEAGSVELEAMALGGLGDGEYACGRILSAGERFCACIALCREHGFGRIEVASLPMAALARVYANEWQRARQEGLEALAASTKIGHQRSAIIANHVVFICALCADELATAETHIDQALELSQRLGARRFEAQALAFLGELRDSQGRRADALRLIREALAISRATGMSYCGAYILGALARRTDDARERRAALAEAEALLAKGAVSHNHLWFYRDAIDAELQMRDWSEAERYAALLEAYTRPEPLPWADFLIARGRVLAAFGTGRRDPAIIEELERLRSQALRIGYKASLPPIEDALRAG